MRLKDERHPPRRLFFLLPTKERTKENCRCFDAADPRPRGCTPLRTPIRKSEGPLATRTQYYCSRLTPTGLPPLLSRGCGVASAGPQLSGAKLGSEQCLPLRGKQPHERASFAGWRRSLRAAKRPEPPLPETAVRRGRACPARSLASAPGFALCPLVCYIVGRDLDPSATFR